MEPAILPPRPTFPHMFITRRHLLSPFHSRCIISLSSRYSMCLPGSSVTILSGTSESVGAVPLTIVRSCDCFIIINMVLAAIFLRSHMDCSCRSSRFMKDPVQRLYVGSCRGFSFDLNLVRRMIWTPFNLLLELFCLLMLC